MNFSRNVILILGFILFLNFLIFAQEDKKEPEYGWKNVAVGNLNFTQTSFSNWARGGEDNWTWLLDFNAKFVNDQEKYNWSNAGKISYGKTKVSGADARKSADEIRLESVFTFKMGAYVNPYVALTGETQLTNAYKFSDSSKVEISNFLDPGYFTESIGFGYEPVKNFKTRLGLAFKQTIADKFAAAYSDDPKTDDEIETVRSEIGMESVTDYSRKLNENILFTTKLEAFSNFESVKEIDVRWDNVFSAKVSKYIVVSFNFKLFYDKDISVKRQIKQILAVGLTYSFI